MHMKARKYKVSKVLSLQSPYEDFSHSISLDASAIHWFRGDLVLWRVSLVSTDDGQELARDLIFAGI